MKKFLKLFIITFMLSTNAYAGSDGENELSKKTKPVMRVNSVYGLLLAVQSGVGLAALPDYITLGVQNIVRVLPDVEGPKTESHFVYPQSLKNLARVKAFRNFLYSKVREWKF